MSKRKLNNDKDVRRKTKPKDYEKGAIVYLHLFRKLGSTEAILYPKFSSKWISWFPEDDYGCGKIFKKVFHETVIKAGKTEESIKEYLDNVRICKDEYIPKEIHEIAKRKGCKVKRSNNPERYLSGYMVKKDCAKKYRNNKSAVLIGLNYDCTLESVENYLNNLPDSIDVRRSQTELQKVLDVGSMDDKVKAIRSYPYWICTYDFNVFLFKYARSCDTQTVLNAIVKLCRKLNVTHMSNGNPIDNRISKNAYKSLEQLDLFSRDSNVHKKLQKCVTDAELEEDYIKWSADDIKKLKASIQKLYPREYDYIIDRYPNNEDLLLWVANKITNNGYKEIVKTIEQHKEHEEMLRFQSAFKALEITDGITKENFKLICDYMEQHYPMSFKQHLVPNIHKDRGSYVRHMWNLCKKEK